MNNNEASNEKVNGDMALESEELELDDVQLATDELAEVVGGGCGCAQDPAQGPGGYYSWTRAQQEQYNDQRFSAAISQQPKPIKG